MLPPMFRLLAKLGVPVRPLHFRPRSLFVLIAAGMAAAFAGLRRFLDLIGADTTRKGRWIHQLGAVNLAMIGAIIGGWLCSRPLSGAQPGVAALAGSLIGHRSPPLQGPRHAMSGLFAAILDTVRIST